MKKPIGLKRKITGHPRTINYIYFLFTAMFAVGIIIGCSTVKRTDSDIIKAISEFLSSIVRNDIKDGFLKSLISSAVTAMTFPLFSMFAGLCAFGAPISLVLPFIYGGLCGITATSYYITYGMKGIGFCTLVMFPYFAIIAATLIKCCNESFVMSMDLFGILTVKKTNKIENPVLKEFFAKYLFLSIPLILAALIQATGFLLFAEMFDFI